MCRKWHDVPDGSHRYILTLGCFVSTGKYTAILAILIVGSFIVPMAQYFWYVRDDDTTDKFFGSSQPQQVKAPEPPKKKGWFN